MQVVVNLPTDDEGLQAFQSHSAEFQATLIVGAIKRLQMDDMSKQKVLSDVLGKLKAEYDC